MISYYDYEKKTAYIFVTPEEVNISDILEGNEIDTFSTRKEKMNVKEFFNFCDTELNFEHIGYSGIISAYCEYPKNSNKSIIVEYNKLKSESLSSEFERYGFIVKNITDEIKYIGSSINKLTVSN